MRLQKNTVIMSKNMHKKEVPTFILAILIFIIFCLSVLSVFLLKTDTYGYSIKIYDGEEYKPIDFVYGELKSLSNYDFFEKTKTQFATEKIDYIEVDLSNMIVRVHKDGEKRLEVPIKTKGREGSWWETPAGIYKIQTKEKSHFSSIGHVYQPWSMAFQGNFYIHGIPYYPDGTPVASTYSGGCIRLETADAKKVYDLASLGMPILVFEKDFSSDDFVYKDYTSDILAKSYIVGDLKNNHVFFSKEADAKLPIASITKLMTALVATEYINLDSNTTVPKEAIIYTSKPRLKAGSKISIYQLLFPLLLESSNESAETIARHYGRDLFIKRMNEKAEAIGMKNSIFADPSGVDPANISTAEDLFMLSKYIYNNRSFIFKITSGKLKDSAYGENIFKDIKNMNDFSDYPNYFGGKVGKTTIAKETSLSVFEITVDGNLRPLVLILLNSEDRISDGKKLFQGLTSRLNL